MKLVYSGRILVSLRAAARNPRLVLTYLKEGPGSVTLSQLATLLGTARERIFEKTRELFARDDSTLWALGRTWNQVTGDYSWACCGAPFLYAATRILKPEVVVETGVANGVSSAYILRALERNSKGDLYSIDLGANDHLPEGKSIGWVVPEELRDRWKLLLGDARDMLPGLLEKLRRVDIFLHDSDHSYEHMMWEFKNAWQALTSGGLLISDDIWVNTSFFDFAKLVDREAIPLFFSNMGGLRR